jgi:hypothetical protein
VYGVHVVLVDVGVVVLDAGASSCYPVEENSSLRVVGGGWCVVVVSCIAGTGVWIVVCGVDCDGRGVDADVDSGVVADVDFGAMWVVVGKCVGCVCGSWGGLSVVVDAGLGCFVELVVGGMVWCRLLSEFPAKCVLWFYPTISCSPKSDLIQLCSLRSLDRPCLISTASIVLLLCRFPPYLCIRRLLKRDCT